MKVATCHPEKKHYSLGLCLTCYEARRRATKPEHREYMRQYLINYKAAHPERLQAAYERRRADPIKRERDRRTKKEGAYRLKYGLTSDGVARLLAEQSNKCGLCREDLTLSAAHVDHCHATGKVRGILCRGCNTGLGALGDNIAGLLRAINYLRKTELLAQSAPVERSTP